MVRYGSVPANSASRYRSFTFPETGHRQFDDTLTRTICVIFMRESFLFKRSLCELTGAPASVLNDAST